jgi:hypothetical protein
MRRPQRGVVKVRSNDHYAPEDAWVEDTPYFPYVHLVCHVHSIAMSPHTPFCSFRFDKTIDPTMLFPERGTIPQEPTPLFPTRLRPRLRP